MYKVIGNATLSFDELAEVLLDVETQVNRRPLSYVEDDIEFPILTPSTFLYQRASHLPEEESWRIEQDLRKRAKFLKSCKEGLWRRWQREYLTALRERHNLSNKLSKFQPKEGDVVIVKGDSKNRGTWNLGVVTQIFIGRDGITRGVPLKTRKGTLERPVQLLYPLELACEAKSEVKEETLNPKAPTFRPQRAAAATANARIVQITEIEDNS